MRVTLVDTVNTTKLLEAKKNQGPVTPMRVILVDAVKTTRLLKAVKIRGLSLL